MFCFRYLAVAASLTGGNALAAFIKMIQVRDKFLGAYPESFIFVSLNVINVTTSFVQVFKINLLILACLARNNRQASLMTFARAH